MKPRRLWIGDVHAEDILAVAATPRRRMGICAQPAIEMLVQVGGAPGYRADLIVAGFIGQVHLFHIGGDGAGRQFRHFLMDHSGQVGAP